MGSSVETTVICMLIQWLVGLMHVAMLISIYWIHMSLKVVKVESTILVVMKLSKFHILWNEVMHEMSLS